MYSVQLGDSGLESAASYRIVSYPSLEVGGSSGAPLSERPHTYIHTMHRLRSQGQTPLILMLLIIVSILLCFALPWPELRDYNAWMYSVGEYKEWFLILDSGTKGKKTRRERDYVMWIWD